jgi:hypothetical protein
LRVSDAGYAWAEVDLLVFGGAAGSDTERLVRNRALIHDSALPRGALS